MTKALIFGKDRPGDPKRNTWRVVSGFPGDDEARAYAKVVGGGNESGAIQNSAEELQRGSILIPDSEDYKAALKESGLKKGFEVALQKLRDDRAERERQEQELREQQAEMKREAERREAIRTRAQELRDEALRDELAGYANRAAELVDAEAS